MTNGDIERKYGALLKETQAAVVSGDAAKRLSSNDPEARKVAREDLTKILGKATVKDGDADSAVAKYALDRVITAETNAARVLKSDHEGLIEELRRTQDKRADNKLAEAIHEKRAKDRDGKALDKHDFHKMARRYLSVTPFETGDKLYDAVGGLHAEHKDLTDAIEGLRYGQDSTLKRTDFVTRIAQYVGRQAEREVKGADVDDLFDEEQKAGRDDREDYMDAVASLVGKAMESVTEGSVENAVRLGDNIANGLRKQMDQMLPKDKRTDYVEAVLKARAEHAKDVFEDDKHAGSREYAGVAKDMFELVR
ncbi:MAG: hypothetical protein ABIH92_01480 [Nanoarchaeota archaeon]